jgi:hypothetical protein
LQNHHTVSLRAVSPTFTLSGWPTPKYHARPRPEDPSYRALRASLLMRRGPEHLQPRQRTIERAEEDAEVVHDVQFDAEVCDRATRNGRSCSGTGHVVPPKWICGSESRA